MAKILKLDKSYDLWLSYSWSSNNHGICGHTFEVIDYFWILKDTYKVGILLCEDIDTKVFRKSISEKYNFTDSEIDYILDNTVFENRPSLVTGTNILFTDGGVTSLSRVTLLFKNILMFACGNKEIKNNTKDNVLVLQDNRVYEPVIKNGIDYKKKILFDRLKTIPEKKTDYNLLYLTKNCRLISHDTFNRIKNEFGDKLLCCVNKVSDINSDDNVLYIEAPIENIWERFDTYIYTRTDRKWDCSPRFIAECKWYNKNVVFFDIDYWDEDKGLYWRVQDIENDFDSIKLTKDDDLFRILDLVI